jgi:acetyl-CoA C-acetyltransferase
MSNSFPEIAIVNGARTPMGRYCGKLRDFTAEELAAVASVEATNRAGIVPVAVDHCVMGNAQQTSSDAIYGARHVALKAGVPIDVPALTVNRLCGSGLQAIISAAQSVLLGDADIAIGGGAENMSRAPYSMPAARFGQRMGDARLVDMMVGALNDPFQSIHMGVTAENVARKYEISRDAQDALALESHRRAAHAITSGYFKEQILPITIASKKGDVVFDTDEHARMNATADDFAKLKPVFVKDNGTVTAGNASGINDAAAAVVLMERGVAERRGVKPLARLVSYAHAGVDPAYMGIGPVPASRKALERAGLTVADLDVIEANEAFAAQACAVSKELGFDPAKVNPNGSGISLGHPIGATGALITVKALYELQRIGGRYALVTMCIGGGQGIAAVFERL